MATGMVFSVTCPNFKALRGPACGQHRWPQRSLQAEQKQKFLPLCPDFVAEIRSPSDRLSFVQAKMQEYLDNGARLGWLIDPHSRMVYNYRSNQPVERLENPATIAGDPVLPGFVLDLQKIWEPGF
jgi:Uma2 family endonuclease